MSARGCAHSVVQEAHEALTTMADARRLASEGALGLSHDALVSILINKMIALTKATSHYHRRPEVAAVYLQRFTAGEDLLAIAEDVQLPPSMLARILLELRYSLRKGKEVLLPRQSRCEPRAPARQPRGIAARRWAPSSSTPSGSQTRGCARRCAWPSLPIRTTARTSRSRAGS